MNIRLPGRRALWYGALFSVLWHTACRGGEQADADDRIRVTATIGMITDIAAIVGGERVRVDGLMGPGVDPHLYKASAGDVRTLAGADVIFYNGLHLEAAMAEVLEEMSERVPSIAVTRGVPESVLQRPAEFQGQFDPHVWFDVRLWMSAVETVRDGLSEFEPTSRALFEENARAYLEELTALDAWVRERAQEVTERQRVLVTAHDAFNYFGRAYGFEVRGLLGISTASEAGTADVQELAEFIVERRIPAMFVETSVPPRTIEAVQAAVASRGFEVRIGGSLFSDAMGDAGTAEGTYVGMVRHNVNTIVDALLEGTAQ